MSSTNTTNRDGTIHPPQGDELEDAFNESDSSLRERRLLDLQREAERNGTFPEFLARVALRTCQEGWVRQHEERSEAQREKSRNRGSRSADFVPTPLMELASYILEHEKKESGAAVLTQHPVGTVLWAAELRPTHNMVRSHIEAVKARESDPAKKAESMAYFSQVLTKFKAPVEMICRLDLLNHFIDALNADLEILQVEACNVLAAISCKEEYAKKVVESGGLRPLATLCDSDGPFGAVHEKAVLALGAVARSSVQNQEAFRDAIAAKAFFEQPPRDPPATRENLTFLLASFCRGEPFLEVENLTPVLDALVHLLSDQGIVVVVEACEWIRYLATNSKEHVDAVTRKGVQSYLVELLLHSNPDVNSAALRALGQIAIAGGGKEITLAGGKSKIEELAEESSNPTVRNEAKAILNAYFVAQDGGAADAEQEGGAAIVLHEGSAAFLVVNEGGEDTALHDGAGTDSVERIGSGTPSSRGTH